jgi:hypothetical protein
MLLVWASPIMSENDFWPLTFPPRMYILFDRIPSSLATGRTAGRKRALTNNRVHFDNSIACLSSNDVENEDRSANGVVRPRRECMRVI